MKRPTSIAVSRRIGLGEGQKTELKESFSLERKIIETLGAFGNSVVKTDATDGFELEITAYGPVLCFAIVHFDDGHSPIELQRYIDFI